MGPLIFIALLALLVVWLISGYNRLVSLRNRFKNAFVQIDVQLKRRYDLIPNLVESAKAYMQHERETLENVIKWRNAAVGAAQAAAAAPGAQEAVRSLGAAEQGLGGALQKMFAVAESYPELKANENIGQLMEELASTENKVAFARQSYNDQVMSYNTAVEQFPTNILASAFSFKQAQALEATQDEAERQAVKVKF